ncbi:MAG: DUF2934 domain-containing protein [Magnetospirillum sp.]|nr:DUF2934 domain-containing protein [Magnetospirillum sp.]
MPQRPPPEITDDMIRARAHHIWEREGRPDGRAEDHWQMARNELAIQLDPGLATEPDPAAEREEVDHPEPVEPLEAVENQGSFPTLTDQDEEQGSPRRRRRSQTKRG